jgi:hypothetical protein
MVGFRHSAASVLQASLLSTAILLFIYSSLSSKHDPAVHRRRQEMIVPVPCAINGTVCDNTNRFNQLDQTCFELNEE